MIHTFGRTERWALLWAAGAAVLLGFLLPEISTLPSAVAIQWLLTGTLGAACGAVLVRFAKRGRLLEPLPFVAAIVGYSFVLRPAYLLSQRDAILGESYRSAGSSVASLLEIRSQEFSLFVHTRLTGDYDAAFTEALLSATAFFGLVCLGYIIAGRLQAHRQSVPTTDSAASEDMRPFIWFYVAVGVAAQLFTLVLIGGPANAASKIIDQSNFQVGFVLLTLCALPVVALLLWASWHYPSGGMARWAFLALLAETVGFYAVLGSRNRILMSLLLVAFARNYVRKRLTVRTLVTSFVVAVLAFSGYLAVRQATYSAPLGQAITQAPRYLLDVRGILNDNTAFDALFTELDFVGESAPHRYGRSFLDAARSFVPTALDPSKPEGGDIAFRRLVWGDRFQAGRPYTLIGEFHWDFGWLGILLGSVLVGVACRLLVRLTPSGGTPGRPRFIALYAGAMFVLYELMIGVWSIGLGFVIQIIAPLCLAVIVAKRRAT